MVGFVATVCLERGTQSGWKLAITSNSGNYAHALGNFMLRPQSVDAFLLAEEFRNCVALHRIASESVDGLTAERLRVA